MTSIGGLSDVAQQLLWPAAVRDLKVLLVIGTRPEAIKMAGLVYELRRREGIAWRLCSTGQHRSMLDETLADLGIAPHVDLGIMGRAPGLARTTAEAIGGLDSVVASLKPDWVVVQGDTTTAFAGAMAAYCHKVPVAHIEAGLRTGNRYSPWPEEGNRRLVAALATRHIAPTETAKANLLKEGIPERDIEVTGNTVIDALLDMHARTASDPGLKARLEKHYDWLDASKHLVLVTGHRRESFGEGFRQICLALQRLARRGDAEIVYPVHLNPSVRETVHAMLRDEQNIHLIEPLAYSHFVYLMSRARILLTDSGGIQEEGPSLGRPVVVMRETSERPEGIAAGTALLAGTTAAGIVREVERLLDDPAAHAAMSRRTNPYGDGTASRRIIEALTRSR